MVCTRPYLTQTVSHVLLCVQLGKPLLGISQVDLCYLKSIMGNGIMFSREHGNPSIIGYDDSYYAGDMDNRKYIARYAFTSARTHICGKSSIQYIMVMSITKAEYMVENEASKEALWLKRLVRELGVE